MLIIQNQKYFDEVVSFAKSVGLYEGPTSSLKNRLDYLAEYGGKLPDGSDKTRALLSRDFAPYSFGFVIEARRADGEWDCWFNGGLVFHGTHDGNGNGSAPTFAVTLTPVSGWSIHT